MEKGLCPDPTRPLDYYNTNGGWSSPGAKALSPSCWVPTAHLWKFYGPPNTRKFSGALVTNTDIPRSQYQNGSKQNISRDTVSRDRNYSKCHSSPLPRKKWALLQTTPNGNQCQDNLWDEAGWVALPQLIWNSEIKRSRPTVIIPILDSILYMGNGGFCWEDKANNPVIFANLFYKETE